MFLSCHGVRVSTIPHHHPACQLGFVFVCVCARVCVPAHVLLLLLLEPRPLCVLASIPPLSYVHPLPTLGLLYMMLVAGFPAAREQAHSAFKHDVLLSSTSHVARFKWWKNRCHLLTIRSVVSHCKTWMQRDEEFVII